MNRRFSVEKNVFHHPTINNLFFNNRNLIPEFMSIEINKSTILTNNVDYGDRYDIALYRRKLSL